MYSVTSSGIAGSSRRDVPKAFRGHRLGITWASTAAPHGGLIMATRSRASDRRVGTRGRSLRSSGVSGRVRDVVRKQPRVRDVVRTPHARRLALLIIPPGGFEIRN